MTCPSLDGNHQHDGVAVMLPNQLDLTWRNMSAHLASHRGGKSDQGASESCRLHGGVEHLSLLVLTLPLPAAEGNESELLSVVVYHLQ